MSNPFGAFGDSADEATGRGGMGAEDDGASARDQAEREKERLEEARIRSVINHLNTKLDQIDDLFGKVRGLSWGRG